MTFGLRELTIFVVTFSLVIFTTFSIVGDLEQNYNIQKGDDFKESFNQMDAMRNYSVSMERIIINQTSGESSQSSALFLDIKELVKNLFTFPKSVFELTITILSESGDYLSSRFGLDPIFFDAAMIILILLTVWFIIQVFIQLLSFIRGGS